MIKYMDSSYQQPHKKPSYRVNLIRQQSQCERNYYKIQQLLPELHHADGFSLSIQIGDQSGQAFFKVIDRAPFTTVLEVKLQANWGEWLALPHFRIRIYHDVRMAEIISINKERHFQPTYTYPNEKMLLPDEKEQLNVLLSEWLNVCLKHGYSIEPVL